LKILRGKDFKPFVSAYVPKLNSFFHHSSSQKDLDQGSGSGSRSEISDILFEDLDPKLFIPDPEHCEHYSVMFCSRSDPNPELSELNCEISTL